MKRKWKSRTWVLGAVALFMIVVGLTRWFLEAGDEAEYAMAKDDGTKVTFFVLGDFGVDDEDPIFKQNLGDAVQVSETMYKVARAQRWPRAVFLTGDLAYPSGVTHHKDDRIDRVFERMPMAFRRRVEFYATPGNHDCEGSISAWSEVRHRIINWKPPEGGGKIFGENRFRLPWGASLRLISLETCSLVCTPLSDVQALNHRCGDKMSKYAQDPQFRNDKIAQLDWLQRVPDKQPGEWLIVMGHWPVYSFRGNGPTRELYDLLLWMRKKRVDFYLAGHDHALQIIRGGDSADPTFLVSGAGGYPLHSDLKKDAAAGFNTDGNAVLVHAQDEPGFMALEVMKDTLILRFINLNGTETYRTVVTRRL